jgi:TonB family protein
MKTIARAVAMLGCAGLAAAAQEQSVAPEATLYDEDVRVVEPETLAYPRIALNARVQGTVIVQVTLNANGAVSAASALSGPPLLHPQTLANVRLWKFAPNRSSRAIVVYDFIIDKTCFDQEVSVFRLPHRNLATVTGCEREAMF